MEKELNNYEQDRKQGGKQVVILNEEQTAETDRLDPEFDDSDSAEEQKSN
jgi:hypothetical protein